MCTYQKNITTEANRSTESALALLTNSPNDIITAGLKTGWKADRIILRIWDYENKIIHQDFSRVPSHSWWFCFGSRTCSLPENDKFGEWNRGFFPLCAKLYQTPVQSPWQRLVEQTEKQLCLSSQTHACSCLSLIINEHTHSYIALHHFNSTAFTPAIFFPKQHNDCILIHFICYHGGHIKTTPTYAI